MDRRSVARQRSARNGRRPAQPRLESLEGRRLLATFLVTDAGDQGDADAPLPGSLRQALTDANTTPGPDVIEFRILGDAAPAIVLASNLPAVTESVVIDGWSQPGAITGQRVTISGGERLGTGLLITGPDVTVKGLVFSGFEPVWGLDVNGWSGTAAIVVRGAGATRTRIQGNLFGTDARDEAPRPNVQGILVQGAAEVLIGTDGDGIDDEREGNIISGSRSSAVRLVEASGTIIAGNRIGTDSSGRLAVTNEAFGILVESSVRTRIGTDGDGLADAIEGNLISGNALGGIAFRDSIGPSLVLGNRIGGDLEGGPGITNGGPGISVFTSTDLIVGSTTHGNRLAFNLGSGVVIGHGSNRVEVSGNTHGANQGSPIAHWGEGPGPRVLPEDAPNDGRRAPVLIMTDADVIEARFRGSPATLYRLQVFGGAMEALEPGSGLLLEPPPWLPQPGSPALEPPLPPFEGDEPPAPPMDTEPGDTPALETAASPFSDDELPLPPPEPPGGGGTGDPSGWPHGWEFLIEVEVLTDHEGLAVVPLPFGPTPERPLLSATVIDPAGNTSEFAADPHLAIGPLAALRLLDSVHIFEVPLPGVRSPVNEALGGLLDVDALSSDPLILADPEVIRDVEGHPVGLRLRTRPGSTGEALVSVTVRDGLLSITGTFAVTVLAASEPDAGDGLRSILDTSQASSGERWTGTVDRGQVDRFGFEVTTAGRLTATVRSSADTMLSVVDVGGRVLSSSARAVPVAPGGAIAIRLAPGQYEVRLEGLEEGDSSYRLTTRFEATAPPGDPLTPPEGPPLPLFQFLTLPVLLDADGDGVPDVARIDGEKLQMMRGLGDGSFQWSTTLLPAPFDRDFSGDMVTGDLDGDGREEVVVFQNSRIIIRQEMPPAPGVFVASGLTSLAPRVDYFHLGVEVVLLRLGDLDGDGRGDLVMLGSSTTGGDRTTRLFVARGLAYGFGAPEVVAVPGDPRSFELGDLNGDGRLDLVVVLGGQSVAAFGGLGDARFQLLQVLADPGIGTYAGLGQAVRLLDLEGDGRLDLVVDTSIVAGESTDPLTPVSSLRRGQAYLSGGGDGTFASSIPLPGSSEDAFYHDFNGDGRLDRIAVAFDGLRLRKYYRTELGIPGGFAPQSPWRLTAGELSTLLVADFDGDGRSDLLTGDLFSPSVLLSGRGESAFGTLGLFPTFATGGSTAADFNGDGVLDLVNGPIVLIGGEDGTFAVGEIFDTDFSSWVAADLNLDGEIDLVGATQELGDFSVPPQAQPIDLNQVAVFLGRGDGTFLQTQAMARREAVEPLLGDLNGDGRADLFYVETTDLGTISADGYPVLESSLKVQLNRGDGSFGSQIIHEAMRWSGFGPVRVQPADTDGDGDLDLLVLKPSAGGPEGEPLGLILNDGKGGFTSSSGAVVASSLSSIQGTFLGDLDGDSLADLVLVGGVFENFNTPALEISRNLGNNRFGDSLLLTPRRLGIPDSKVDRFRWGSLFPDLDDIDLADPEFDWRNWSTLTTYRDPLTGRDTLYAALSTQVSTGPLDFFDVSTVVALSWGAGSLEAMPGVRYWDSGEQLSELIAVADLDGDGRGDLLGTQTDGDPVHWLDDGASGFVASDLTAGDQRGRPRLADLDGDGVQDLVVADREGAVLMRLGRAGEAGVYEPPVVVNPNAAVRDLTILRTGRGSVIAATERDSNTIALHAYEGGSFVRRVVVESTDPLAVRIVAADLNGDGDEDLAWLGASRGVVGVALAGGGGRFVPAQAVAVGPGINDLAAVDLDGDTDLDLALIDARAGQVRIVENLGEGRLVALEWAVRAGVGPSRPQPAGPPDPAPVTSGDLPTAILRLEGRGSGLVVLNKGTDLVAMLGDGGRGILVDPVLHALDFAPRSFAAGDFDRDGDDDLAVLGAERVALLLGDGAGGFVRAATIAAGPAPTAIGVGDYDGDGELDLLVGSGFGDILALVGDGAGGFRPFEPPGTGIALAVSDLDGDGVDDFVFANRDLDRVTVRYGRQNNLEVVGDQADGLLAPGSVRLADLDGDGRQDLIVANTGANAILVYSGLADGTFSAAWNGASGFFVGTSPSGVTVADVNTDGRPDLVVANTGSNDVSVLLGVVTASGASLVAGPRVPTDAGPVATVVQDIDSDGRPDLMISNRRAGTVQVVSGLGGGFFDSRGARRIPVGLRPSAIWIGPFDAAPGDDVVTINEGSDTMTVISDIGVVSSRIMTIPTGGLRPVAAVAAQLDLDGRLDLIVAHGGDGRLTLLMSGREGPTLTATLSRLDLPRPTSLALARIGPGVVDFYVSTVGREVASRLSMNWLDGANTAGLFDPSTPANPSLRISLPAIAASVTAEILGRLSSPDGDGQSQALLEAVDGSALLLIATVAAAPSLPVPDGDQRSSSGQQESQTGADLAGSMLGQQTHGEGGRTSAAGSEAPRGESGSDREAGRTGAGEAADPTGDARGEEQTLSPLGRYLLGIDQAFARIQAETTEQALRETVPSSELARHVLSRVVDRALAAWEGLADELGRWLAPAAGGWSGSNEPDAGKSEDSAWHPPQAASDLEVPAAPVRSGQGLATPSVVVSLALGGGLLACRRPWRGRSKGRFAERGGPCARER